MSSALVSSLARVWDERPRGRTLPPDVWRARHRGMLVLLWAHAAGLVLLSLVQGYTVAHSLAEGVIVGFFAVAATVMRDRTRASLAVSFGLLTASAVLVHVTQGMIEAHFHFFVMIAVITLYEDWLPFGLAFVYVVAEHGLGGALAPESVYSHAAAQQHPWRWAAIHGVFVMAAGAANVVSWRLSANRTEALRRSERRAHESEERFRSIFEAAPVGITLGSLEGCVIESNQRREEMLGYSAEELAGTNFVEFTHPDDRVAAQALLRELLEGRRRSFKIEKRDLRRDGAAAWTSVTVAVIRDRDGAPTYVLAMAEDIADRKAAEAVSDALLAREREQNERLRELDRLKDSFVASVSHELRTPLTSIRGYLELVLEGEGGELTDEQRTLLSVVDRNSDRLLRLVGDLLFVAQVDAGKLTLERSDVALEELVHEAVASARPAAEAKEIEMVTSVEALPVVEGDRARLAQLLDNLVSNAIKFTPAGGQVEVRAADTNGQVCLEVRDTGIGIPADEQPRLFERFFRANAADAKAIMGTGLGLSIAKAIVDAHGGAIAVESEEGVGTTFRVELPPAQRSSAADLVGVAT